MRDPLPNVGRAVAQDDASAGFAFAEKLHSLTVGEDQIAQFQHDGVSRRHSFKRLTQLVDILRAQAAAYRQHDGCAVSLALDPEHLSSDADRNSRSNKTALNRELRQPPRYH